MKNSDMIKMRPTLPVDSDRIRQLRILCQKPRHLEEIWSWYVLRRISVYVTLMLGRTRVTPNGISWSSLLFFAMTGWFLMSGEVWGYLAAILCYNLGYLCDCLDGELARLKEMTGRVGVFVDTLIRAMSIPILTGVSLAFLRETGRVEIDLLPATLIYGATVIGTLGLLVPLAYNYVGLKADENDPVSEMRTSSAFMEWLAFFTGMPGFFALLLVMILAETVIPFPLVSLLLIVFLGVTALKTLVRLYLTTSKLK